MAEDPHYTVWQLEEELLELKPTFQQRVRSKTGIRGNAYTLKPEIKQWMRVVVKDHWYLSEVKKQSQPVWGAPPLSITVKFNIHFRDRKDAMAFKLTWL